MTDEIVRQPLVFDSTLREGEQSYGVLFDQDAKVAIARLLSEIGIQVIEVGHVTAAPSIEAAARAIRDLPLRSELLVHALPRRSEVDGAKSIGAEWVGFFLSFNPETLTEKYSHKHGALVEEVRDAIRYAKGLGLKVRFTCEDATRTELDTVISALGIMREEGADLLGYADTVGCVYPSELGSTAATLVEAFGGDSLHFHGHNDHGFALTNAAVALDAGFLSVDATIWGLGERMGIVPMTELLLYLQHFTPDFAFDLSRLGEVEQLVGKCINGDKYFARRFAHKAGLHCAAAMSDPHTYEPLDPGRVGWKRKFVFSKLSGHRGIASLFAAAGKDQSPEVVDACVDALKHTDLLESEDVEEILSLIPARPHK